jgi:hypothetical protein
MPPGFNFFILSDFNSSFSVAYATVAALYFSFSRGDENKLI